jgi:hypothetical protein
MDSAEHDELVMIRTQLTVALLAVTQLQRKHAASADADRLLAYVATALARINREVHKIDALMVRLEDRAAMHVNPAHPRIRCPSGVNRGPQEHDEP